MDHLNIERAGSRPFDRRSDGNAIAFLYPERTTPYGNRQPSRAHRSPSGPGFDPSGDINPDMEAVYDSLLRWGRENYGNWAKII